MRRPVRPVTASGCRPDAGGGGAAPRRLAGRTAVLALAVVLSVLAGPAAADHLCDDLLLLNRLSARAQRLATGVAAQGPTAAYRFDLALARRRFEPGLHPPAIAALAARLLDGNRRFLAAAEARAGPQALAARVRAPDWQADARALRRVLDANGCRVPPAEPRASSAPAPTADAGAPGDSLRASSPAGAAALAHPATAAVARGLLPVVGLEVLALAGLLHLLARHRFKRGSRRHVCNLRGALEGHLYCEPTVLIDLSGSGCKLRLNAPFTPDRPVLVHVGTRSLPARPRWANAHYAGLRFDRRLTEAELRDILATAEPAADPDGPPVPALPCHSASCRDSCARYRRIGQIRAGAVPAGAGDLPPRPLPPAAG